jgi:hypothetical protein
MSIFLWLVCQINLDSLFDHAEFYIDTEIKPLRPILLTIWSIDVVKGYDSHDTMLCALECGDATRWNICMVVICLNLTEPKTTGTEMLDVHVRWERKQKLGVHKADQYSMCSSFREIPIRILHLGA